MLSQGCYNVVTRLSQGCYNVVTSLPQGVTTLYFCMGIKNDIVKIRYIAEP